MGGSTTTYASPMLPFLPGLIWDLSLLRHHFIACGPGLGLEESFLFFGIVVLDWFVLTFQPLLFGALSPTSWITMTMLAPGPILRGSCWTSLRPSTPCTGQCWSSSCKRLESLVLLSKLGSRRLIAWSAGSRLVVITLALVLGVPECRRGIPWVLSQCGHFRITVGSNQSLTLTTGKCCRVLVLRLLT